MLRTIPTGSMMSTAWMTAAATLLTFALASPAPATAQTASTTPGCATLLTADELTKAVGTAMKDMGAQTRSPGETECAWMLRGGSAGFKTVSVQFYDMTAIKASESAPALDKFFEQAISFAEGATTNKREALKGIGQNAFFLAADPQVVAIVQRPDGVARIVGNNLTKAQITAVAQAVATP